MPCMHSSRNERLPACWTTLSLLILLSTMPSTDLSPATPVCQLSEFQSTKNLHWFGKVEVHSSLISVANPEQFERMALA